MSRLEFKLTAGSYPVIITQKNLTEELQKLIHGKQATIITDETISNLYGDSLAKELACSVIVVPAGEQSKSWSQAGKVIEQLAEKGLSRSSIIIALGGGVIGDLAGFVASVYLRGIDYIQVPTTLLSQIDSSMGGKTGLNLDSGKNLVGAFHQPKAVVIATSLLQSLPTADFIDGLAEMIKYGFIHDASILEDLEKYSGLEELHHHLEELILKCCSIKKKVVEEDEFDTGIRMTLNFGHTLGHAIEKSYGLSHGRSVSLGMMLISQIAVNKKLVAPTTLKKLEKLLIKYGLPVDTRAYSMENLLDYVGRDKKNINGRLHLVLCPNPGESIIYPVDFSFFDKGTK
ncbi:MAG: 3-dehydroquinate synthase [Brevinema sp.]